MVPARANHDQGLHDHLHCPHRFEQYTTSSQTLAHFFRQMNGRPQAPQILLGNSDFLIIFITTWPGVQRQLFPDTVSENLGRRPRKDQRLTGDQQGEGTLLQSYNEAQEHGDRHRICG